MYKEKRVLYVISEFFAPNQNIGAVKFTKIVKFLAQTGEYKIYVFTRKNFKKADEILAEDLSEIKYLGCEVYVIDAGRSFYKKSKLEKIYKKTIKRILPQKNPAKVYVDRNSKEMRKFALGGMKLIENLNLPAPNYMISTYDDYGGHLLGQAIKKKYGDSVYWVTDFRDQVGIMFQDKKTRAWADEYSKTITEQSDCTTISAGMANNMVLAENMVFRDIHIGFDPADGKKIKKIDEALSFTYTGSYYGNRTIRPLLKVICELADEGRVDKNNFSFGYCGVYGDDIKNELAEFGLAENFVDWGTVSHLQSMLIQNRSDILLSCIWNYYDYQGAIGGKTFEYLGLEKPIVAIVRGDMPNSDMKKLIVNGQCGVCYEEANHEEDIVFLKEKIYKYYVEKMGNGCISHKNNYEGIKKYDLNYIAKQYDEILKTKGLGKEYV